MIVTLANSFTGTQKSESNFDQPNLGACQALQQVQSQSWWMWPIDAYHAQKRKTTSIAWFFYIRLNQDGPVKKKTFPRAAIW